MIGSFIILCITVVLYMVGNSLMGQYGEYISGVMQYMPYVIAAAAVIFAIFVILEMMKVVSKIIRDKKRNK